MGNHINHRREVSPARGARRLQGLLSELSTKIEELEQYTKKGHGISVSHVVAVQGHIGNAKNEVTHLRSELALATPHIAEHHGVEEKIHKASQRIGVLHQAVGFTTAADRLSARLAALGSDSGTESYVKELSEAVEVMIELLADSAPPSALREAMRNTQIILGAASDKYAHLS